MDVAEAGHKLRDGPDPESRRSNERRRSFCHRYVIVLRTESVCLAGWLRLTGLALSPSARSLLLTQSGNDFFVARRRCRTATAGQIRRLTAAWTL